MADQYRQVFPNVPDRPMQVNREASQPRESMFTFNERVHVAILQNRRRFKPLAWRAILGTMCVYNANRIGETAWDVFGLVTQSAPEGTLRSQVSSSVRTSLTIFSTSPLKGLHGARVSDGRAR